MSRTNFIKSGDVFTIVELKYYATLLVIILICSSHLCGSNAHIFVLNGSILSELFTIYYASETEARPTIKIIRFWKKNVLTPKVPQVAVIIFLYYLNDNHCQTHGQRGTTMNDRVLFYFIVPYSFFFLPSGWYVFSLLY